MVHAWIPRRSQRAGHRRALAREKSISRETGLTYKPHTGSGHSAPAQSRIQIGGILNWVNVRIYYRVTGISRKRSSLRLGSRMPRLHPVGLAIGIATSDMATFFVQRLFQGRIDQNARSRRDAINAFNKNVACIEAIDSIDRIFINQTIPRDCVFVQPKPVDRLTEILFYQVSRLFFSIGVHLAYQMLRVSAYILIRVLRCDTG